MHKYAKTGVYFITFYGDIDALKGHSGMDWDSGGGNKRSRVLIETLKAVLVPKNYTSPLKYAPGSFFGCYNLEYISPNIFENLTNCKTLYHLFDGCKIKHLPNGLLKNCINLKDARFIFEACDIIEIPEDLFENCTELLSVRCAFHRSNKISRVPGNLFKNNHKITDIRKCFQACRSLVDFPEEIFDPCPDIIYASETFSKENMPGYAPQQYITSIPPLWERKNEDGSYKVREYYAYAKACLDLPNYEDIPLDWRT